MLRNITRRDILHGFGAMAASTFVPGAAFAEAALAAEKDGQLLYPPGMTGMRGDHDGSFDVAHALARQGKRDWGTISEPGSDVYDLIVVGAGLSGLAAAHFFLKENPKARVLLMDNHDDFGGHAKRNEFQVRGKTWLGYGGSQSLVEPAYYPEATKTLINDLGIDLQTLGNAYDQGFFKRNGLAASIHFDKRLWGVDRVLPYDLGSLSYLPLATSDVSPHELVSQMPISVAAQQEFLRLLTTTESQLDMPDDEREDYLYRISYRHFLEKHLNIHEPEVFTILQDLTLDSGTGIEATAASSAMGYLGLPGGAAAGSQYGEDDPYIHHFPDGNASIARLMVRQMIPGVAEGSTAEDIVGARFDYSKLDLAASQVRLRLNSTAIQVRHDGDPASSKTVAVDYVKAGQAFRVRAKNCVLACYNNIIPSMCPELPADQREALSESVRYPILYTNVALNNWRAWKDIGIGGAVGSGNYHPLVMLDFPVSYGGQKISDDPDTPMIAHMEKFPHVANQGLSKREQRRLGRAELLATSFETMERNIREQLTSLLSGGDFDPARDIAGITVNRWAHGYSDDAWGMDEPDWDGRNDERRPNVRGRKPFGRVTIANSDAGGSAMLEAAVEQAYRAIGEIS